MVQVLDKISIPIISSCYPKISKEQSTLFLHKKAMASSRKYQGFHLVFWFLCFTCCLIMDTGIHVLPALFFWAFRFKENLRIGQCDLVSCAVLHGMGQALLTYLFFSALLVVYPSFYFGQRRVLVPVLHSCYLVLVRRSCRSS